MHEVFFNPQLQIQKAEAENTDNLDTAGHSCPPRVGLVQGWESVRAWVGGIPS